MTKMDKFIKGETVKATCFKAYDAKPEGQSKKYCVASLTWNTDGELMSDNVKCELSAFASPPESMYTFSKYLNSKGQEGELVANPCDKIELYSSGGDEL